MVPRLQLLASRSNRGLSAVNAVQVTAYIRRKHEILLNCNAFERARKLQQSCDRHTFAERLDGDVLSASLAAEKHLPHFDEPAWSKDLAASRQKVVLLKKHLSALKTGLDHRTILTSDLHRFDPSLTLPPTITACSKMLREAKKEVQEKVDTSIERRDSERNRKLKALEESGTPEDKHRARQLRRIKKPRTSKICLKNLSTYGPKVNELESLGSKFLDMKGRIQRPAPTGFKSTSRRRFCDCSNNVINVTSDKRLVPPSQFLRWPPIWVSMAPPKQVLASFMAHMTTQPSTQMFDFSYLIFSMSTRSSNTPSNRPSPPKNSPANSKSGQNQRQPHHPANISAISKP